MGRLQRLVHIGAAIVTVLLLSDCAQRLGITGGEIDRKAPSLVRSSPDTFATEFDASRIKLDFDEYVQVQDVRNNLLITPVLRYEPNVVASNRRIIVNDIDDSLWPNTTYVIEFNEAICDITENNPAKGFRYVFSTGMYIDSLRVQGEVKDAYTLKPKEDVFVFLYEDLSDSAIFKSRPRYIGRSNKEGQFTVSNLKAGRYNVLYLDDGNRNYFYNPGSEMMDFHDEPLSVDTGTNSELKGLLFAEEDTALYLDGYGFLSRWAFYMTCNRRIDTLDLQFIGDAKIQEGKIGRSYNEARDSVVVWIKDSTFNAENLEIIARINMIRSDTALLSYSEKKKKEVFKWTGNVTGGKLDLGTDLQYQFDYPLAEVRWERIELLKDSSPIAYEHRISETGRNITIGAKWIEEANYEIRIDSGALVRVDGLSNDSIRTKFATQSVNQYGTIEISLQGIFAESGILMIVDKNDMPVRKVILAEKFRYMFEYLKPGEYFLKFIIDGNGNGRWDAGSFIRKEHAEKVFKYPASITIRSNWDQVIEWKFN